MANPPDSAPAPLGVVATRKFVGPGDPVPKPAHRFFWTRVGADISLEVAYFDLPELREVMNAPVSKDGPFPSVTAYVLGTYVISPTSALELLRAATQLANDLQQQNMLTADQIKEATEPPTP